MGTRRSKHDHGRKPRRKDNGALTCKAVWDTPNFDKGTPTAAEILAKPAYPFGLLLNQNLHWQESDKEKLRILADANAEPEKTSLALGRDPKSIAYKARDVGITLPPAWAALLPKPKYIAHPRQPKILLNYPFFIQVDKDKDANLVAVNNLVPKSIPDHMRGDICQDILLAVYEGKVNLATLQKRPDLMKQFVSRWRKENLERSGYGMMTIDPYGDDKRSWEEQAAARADWDYNQRNDACSAYEAQSIPFTPATQIDDVYLQEIQREHLRRVDAGETLSFDEVARLVEQGDREVIRSNLVADRIRIAKYIKDVGFILCSKIDTNAAYYGKRGARKSQYVKFKIPASQIPELEIRISDHARHRARDDSQLDTYKLGVDGVLGVLEQLAENVDKYERIHRRHNDFYDVAKEVGIAA